MLSKRINLKGSMAWSNSTINNCLFVQLSSCDQFILKRQLVAITSRQISRFDITDQNMKPALIGETQAEACFCSLAWDNFGMKEDFGYGIIAGGMSDGSVSLWDPKLIVSDYREQNEEISDLNQGCISLQAISESPVNAVSFNPHKPNLLASGGDQVLIHNLGKNVEDPEVVFPGERSPHGTSHITSVTWNQKILHILASASRNSVISVWDLKTNQPIFDFSNSIDSGEKNVCLSWNPEIATQLAVTSNQDQMNDELQIWDLRFPKGPVQVFKTGHSVGGITGVNWCVNDPTLLLSSGGDGVKCWNYQTGEQVKEFKTDTRVSEVAWSKKLPGIFSVTLEKDESLIFQMNAEGELDEYAPKWLKPVVGASWGFGDNLMVFSQKNKGVLSEYKVTQQSQTATNVIHEYNEFRKKEIGSLEYCSAQSINDSLSWDDRTEWKYLQMLFQSEEDQLKELGFDKEKIVSVVEKFTGKIHKEKDPDNNNLHKKASGQYSQQQQYSKMSLQDANGFFDQLRTETAQKNQKEKMVSQQDDYMPRGSEIEQKEIISRNVNWDTGAENIIKNNILIGNFEGAIDAAMKCGRTVEALLLAYSKSPQTFEETMKSYFLCSKDTFVKTTIRLVVEKNLDDLVSFYDISKWKEILALIISNGTSDTKQGLFQRFIGRLKEEQPQIMFIVSILAKDFDFILQYFSQHIQQFPKNSEERYIALCNAVQKIIVLSEVNEQISENTHCNVLLQEFAQYLVENSCYVEALSVLSILQLTSNINWKTLMLKDRILNSSQDSGDKIGLASFESHMPFEVEQIRVKPRKKKQREKQASPRKSKGQKPKNRRQIFQPVQQPQVQAQPSPNRVQHVMQKKTRPQQPRRVVPPVRQQVPPKRQKKLGNKRYVPLNEVNEDQQEQVQKKKSFVPNKNLAPPMKKTAPPPPPVNRTQKNQLTQQKQHQQETDVVSFIQSVAEYIPQIEVHFPTFPFHNPFPQKSQMKMVQSQNCLEALAEKIENELVSDKIMQLLRQMTVEWEKGRINDVLYLHQQLAKIEWRKNKEWLIIFKKVFKSV